MKTDSLDTTEANSGANSSPATEQSNKAPGRWSQGQDRPDADAGFDRVRQGAPRDDEKDQYRGQSGYGGLARSGVKTEHEASEHRASASGQTGAFGEGNYGGELGQSQRGGVSSYGNSSGSRYSIDNEQGTSNRTLGPKESFGSAKGAAPVSTNVGQYAGEYDDKSNDKLPPVHELTQADPLRASASQASPPASRSDDLHLQEEIGARLAEHAHLELRDVSVSVANKIVHLEGTVPERRMKHAIEDLADNVDGVLDVDNRIKVRRRDEAVATFASGYSAGQAYANADLSEDPQGPGPATFGAASAKAAAKKGDPDKKKGE